MKESTKALLDRELASNKYTLFGIDTTGACRYLSLRHLFDLYLKSEITSIDKVFLNVEEFQDYMMSPENMSRMDIGSKQVFEEALMCMINNFDFCSRVYGSDSNVKLLTQFADTVCKVGKNQHSILDVGATYLPYSSFVMAKHGKKVTAMDRSMNIFDSFFSNLGVEYKNEYFSQYTDTSPYDMVVGRHPCGAIDSIVKSCGDIKKPYFIELCDCEYQGESYDKIVEYLKTKDKNLRALERNPGSIRNLERTIYVHNVDMYDRELQDILMETN